MFSEIAFKTSTHNSELAYKFDYMNRFGKFSRRGCFSFKKVGNLFFGRVESTAIQRQDGDNVPCYLEIGGEYGNLWSGMVRWTC